MATCILTQTQLPSDAIDKTLHVFLASASNSTGLSPATRLRRRDAHFKQIVISAQAMAALRDEGRLNNEVLYGCMASLASCFTSRLTKMAVLSTFPYTAWREGTAVSRLFASIADTKFWARPIIVVPIHDDNHWMIAFVYTDSGRVEMFDSLADNARCERHARVSGRRYTGRPPDLWQGIAAMIWALQSEAYAMERPGACEPRDQWSCRALAVRAFFQAPWPRADPP